MSYILREAARELGMQARVYARYYYELRRQLGNAEIVKNESGLIVISPEQYELLKRAIAIREVEKILIIDSISLALKGRSVDSKLSQIAVKFESAKKHSTRSKTVEKVREKRQPSLENRVARLAKTNEELTDLIEKRINWLKAHKEKEAN